MVGQFTVGAAWVAGIDLRQRESRLFLSPFPAVRYNARRPVPSQDACVLRS